MKTSELQWARTIRSTLSGAKRWPDVPPDLPQSGSMRNETLRYTQTRYTQTP